MSETKHTPGPWFVQNGFNTIYSFYGETSGLTTAVASALHKQLKGGEEEAGANAKLIAAAPDLLEALKGLVNDVKGKPNDTRYATHLKIAEAAIEKATK